MRGECMHEKKTLHCVHVHYTQHSTDQTENMTHRINVLRYVRHKNTLKHTIQPLNES